ncbi:MAG: hypothetical protein U0935_15235 [Pirellulales bacterium]
MLWSAVAEPQDSPRSFRLDCVARASRLQRVGWLMGRCLSLSLPLLLWLAGSVSAADSAPKCYLIGNSLTWDTVPPRLAGDVQWHVDCGVNLPYIRKHPEKPCVEASTLWPAALRDRQYDIVSVQPHYGSTLAEDVDVISSWMELQPQAVFVVHTGWATHAQRAAEMASYAPPTQMTHGPLYLRALLAALRARHPQRTIRTTLAQNLLAAVAEDIAAGRAPWKDVAELYRDDIHLTHDHGKYLMHNAMRRALGQPRSAAGFTGLRADWQQYLDQLLDLLDPRPADAERLRQILTTVEPAQRAAWCAQIEDPLLRQRVTDLLPAIDLAARQRPRVQALEAEVQAAGGRLFCIPRGPQWLYLATGDVGTEIFDVPAAIDLYNGNNPLKGQGGRNEAVDDDWLSRLADWPTLQKLDLANCAIQGPGLKHLSRLTALRELNLTLTPIRDEALAHLGGLTDLRNLGLASTQCTGTGFTHLQGLRQLESVNFHFTPLNDDGLAAIARVPISSRLWFAHTHFTDAGAVHLRQLVQLKRCGIGSTAAGSSGEAVASLADLPLEDLSLLDRQATPAGIAHAARIKTLRRLDVSHGPTVDDDSLALVARLPRLEEFRLGSASVTDAGLLRLADCKTLKRLWLSGLKQVTPAGIAQLRQARPDLVVEVP